VLDAAGNRTGRSALVILARERRGAQLRPRSGEAVGRDINQYRRLFDVLHRADGARSNRFLEPVIAEVHGHRDRAALPVVRAAILAVASGKRYVRHSACASGCSCTTPMVALTRAIGRKRAMEMLLTGRPVDAHTAVDWGLVNRAVPAAELKSETRKLACHIAEASDLTLAIGKQRSTRRSISISPRRTATPRRS